MTTVHHALTLSDSAAQPKPHHGHCTCGWQSRRHAKVATVEKHYHRHVATAERVATRAARRKSPPTPAPLTPASELPEELR